MRHPDLLDRRYHLWPHGGRVLDLGDDVHVAAQLRDFAAHDYALRGVRVRGSGPFDVVAYYDGQYQSRLTQDQLDLVRAWVRRYAAPPRVPSAPPGSTGGRAAWLALALVPAVLAVVFVTYTVARGGAAARDGGPVLVSAAAALSLISAVITWRRTRGGGARALVRSEAAPTAGARRAPPAGGAVVVAAPPA